MFIQHRWNFGKQNRVYNNENCFFEIVFVGVTSYLHSQYSYQITTTSCFHKACGGYVLRPLHWMYAS